MTSSDERSSRQAEPLVSVIMPAFNAKTLVSDAVSSLMAQTYRNWELVLVCDDWDDYGAVLPSDSRVRQCVSSRCASGPGAARNVGLRHALGELVTHLDADDLFHPERLEYLVPLAIEHGIALDNMRILDFESGAEIGVLFGSGRTGLDFDGALGMNYPLFPVYRKDLVSEWDEDIAFAEDVLFNLRAISRVSSVPVLNRFLMDYRVRPGSISCSEESGELAEGAYAEILKRLHVSDFGFYASTKAALIRMFERKARLNRTFLSLESGIKSFAEYASFLGEGDEASRNAACS